MFAVEKRIFLSVAIIEVYQVLLVVCFVSAVDVSMRTTIPGQIEDAVGGALQHLCRSVQLDY